MSLSETDKRTLIMLARQGVEARVCGKPMPRSLETAGVLGERRGCFVTLTNHDRLRGCIGSFQPDRPLAETVVAMGEAAARDPRFVTNPITSYELPEITVEVSVLSPLEETDHPEQLEVGTHGVYIISQGRGGCYLPEVATDQGWDALEMLRSCCADKAGMEPDAWRRPDVKVYLFTSEKFSEEDIEG